jgi:archaellum component FlaC
MNETRNTESQISTRGLDSEMEKKMENNKEKVQEAINTLNAEYKSQQDDAKHICESLKYLRSKGQENSDLYNNLFRHLNNLSDEREVNRISVQRLEDYLKALV